MIKTYKIQNDIKALKWMAYDSNFAPAQLDARFKQWIKKRNNNMEYLREGWGTGEFPEYKRKIWSLKTRFLRYLQLRDYYNRKIRGIPSTEVNVII